MTQLSEAKGVWQSTYGSVEVSVIGSKDIETRKRSDNLAHSSRLIQQRLDSIWRFGRSSHGSPSA